MPEEFKAHLETAEEISKLAMDIQFALIKSELPEEPNQEIRNKLALDWQNNNAAIFREVFDNLVTHEMDILKAWKIAPKETLKTVREEMEKYKMSKAA